MAVEYPRPYLWIGETALPRRRVLWIGILIVLLGCITDAARPKGGAESTAAPLSPHCEGAGALDATLFLVGDAGAPRAPREPLLDALASEASARVAMLGSDRVAIALLGDNVYPSGLHAPGHEERPEDERRLNAQLEALRRSGARRFVLPGNHDWSNGETDGWEAVQRQTLFVAEHGASEMPPDGCAGPLSATLGEHLELVFLDTQWWLHDGPRPDQTTSGCAATSEADIERALGTALRDAGERHAIVLAHHPLRTGGPHGGKFGWKEHVFPLRELSPSLWIPIPLLGSILPVARMLGVSVQDFPSDTYQAMIASIERGLEVAPPLVFAAGHEHGLQLIRGGGSPSFHVVSGAGSLAYLTWAYPVEGTLFAAAEPGYVRLDAFADGAVELTLEEVAGEGARREIFSACLAAVSPPN